MSGHDSVGGGVEALRLWLLGGFSASVGDRTISQNEWRLRKAAALIKLLTLSPDHRLHREQAMEVLWPELGKKAASNNLRQTLHAARAILDQRAGSRYLASEHDLLVLCPQGQLWVDVNAFEEAAATARRSREPGAYRAAIGLYAGELLPGDLYEEWVENRRRELRQLYLGLLTELAVLYEQRGEYEEAIEVLQKAMGWEPALEETHASLMRLYALSGRREAALTQYERLRASLRRELGAEPSAPTRRLREEIAAGRFAPARSAPEEQEGTGWHNLPTARTSFIGRERELVEIQRALAMTRLLTLTGMGGSGKTRLALEVARDLVHAYTDGVWLAQLAPISEPVLVPQAVAGALGISEQPNRSLIDTLVDSLRDKVMLLVLDNCEHLIDACAHLTETLLDSCPRLRILATSREPLNVANEATWPVPPLSLPGPHRSLTVEELERSESARLFLERARYRNLAFTLTPRNSDAVANICWRLEGIPLAIELAAARVEVLSAEQIAARLGDLLKLLSTSTPTEDPKHRAMRATLEWSHELLSQNERQLFRRLSTFAGGWTLEAVEAVGPGDGIEEGNVLDLLSRLVDKSLVTAQPETEVEVRFRFLEPIRQYARELLEESEEADTVRRHHAEFFLALAEEAEPQLRGPQQGEWMDRLEVEHDNLRAVLSWALDQGEIELGLRLCGALGEFWQVRGHLQEGQRWLEAMLAKRSLVPTPAQVKALMWAGTLAWMQGHYERARALSEDSLKMARQLEETSSEAAALERLGSTAIFQGEFERGGTLYEEAVKLYRRTDDTVGLARTLPFLGFIAMTRDDHERAVALHEESLTLARDMGDELATCLSLNQGALAFLRKGNHQRARELCVKGLELSRQLGIVHFTVTHLRTLAHLASAEDQPVRSARLWGVTEALSEMFNLPLSPVEQYLFAPHIASARAQLSEEAWEAAFTEGRKTTFEEAVEYALSDEEQRSPVTSPAPEAPQVGAQPAALTRRENEVATLVARGLENHQVATELGISKRTVDTHVSRILRKLGLDSRTQLTVWVLEQRLQFESSNPEDSTRHS
jgi:predicted ATPase/DNA-binding SARP family transcriptional activator/DNA-binding CsgD family transcriptional regulator